VAKKLSRKRAARRSTTTRGRGQTKVVRRKTAARAAASRGSRRARGPKANRPKKPSAASTATTAVKGVLAGAVQAVTRRLPGAEADTDAITLLETDHRRLEDLLKRCEETTDGAVKERTALLDTITAAMTVHEMMEEKVLYPALKRYPEGRDIVLEGFQEHHVADVILQELHRLSTEDERWGAKFKVLKENIEHHIGEEEGPMFRTARGVMTRDELARLGARMAALKADAERR
jgi:hypothetical protein